MTNGRATNRRQKQAHLSTPPPARIAKGLLLVRVKRNYPFPTNSTQKKELLRMGFEPTVFALLFEMLEQGFLV